MKKRIHRKKKPSFFERLTGAYDDEADFLNDDFDEELDERIEKEDTPSIVDRRREEMPEKQLSVDLVNTPDDIVITAAIPGVEQDEIDISVTREVVTITVGSAKIREEYDGEYFYQEVFWGSQARTIVLPQEVEVDEAKADIKNGILTIILPKIDKERKTKLKVSKR